ncbi:2'-5' RNA ligase family protein [Staphylospora marina]|uniref:2'-5' RNA ligase family protein n=1 Tax=Staphylospora marina TaxID=2490858 RepID=UPI000F5BBD2B|nr:2'-5' RNA ligase family protein [Staphylospora marina]
MYFGIAVFPQKHVQDVANSYRKRYDPHYTLIPPHITLMDRFEMAEEEAEKLVPELERIASETEAFRIRLHKVSNFYPASHTIYLAVEDSAPLVTLHKKIKSVVGRVESPYEFIPHLTIGQKLPQDELHDIYSSLRMTTFDLETKIDRFHLLYQLENGSWNIYQSFLLKR